MPDLTELLGALKSDDAQERVRAVERAAVAIERLTHAVVGSLETAGRHQHYVAEHVHRFGTLMVEPLEELLARADDRGTSVLCALLLSRLHSRAGVAELVKAVTEDSDWATAAATALADVHAPEATAALVHRLRTVPLEAAGEIEALLSALDRLDHEIPADLVTRFQSAPVSEPTRSLIAKAVTATSE